jgi:hypothetical protein
LQENIFGAENTKAFCRRKIQKCLPQENTKTFSAENTK